ncbi:MAG: LON peptidase substrate-binding domain-containing protein, partial [Methylicorpusculum sp.]|nr:LON peptidase substrate-binding domain-containing protein [Methylicorpusculum sp.]
MTIQDLKKLLPGTKSASENALSKTSPEDSPQVPQLPDDALIIVPVRATVLFPQVVMPLVIGRKLSIEALQQAIRLEKPIGLLMQRDNNDIDPKPDDLYPTGTVAEILRYIAIPDGTHHVACQGTQRFRVKAFIPDYPFLAAHVELYEEPEVSSRDIDARVITVKEKAIEVLNLTRQSAIEVVNAIQSMANPSLLADLIASYLIEKAEEKQEILALFDIQQRFDKILELLNYRIEVLKLSNQINEQTQESMGQKQREFMLREQMRAIQKELGEGEENTAEIEEISKAITAANMPEEAEKQARKELSRLQHMSDASGEYSMVRTYLDWLTELPWSKASPGVIDIAKARDILNADHYGLDKIKQ